MTLDTHDGLIPLSANARAVPRTAVDRRLPRFSLGVCVFAACWLHPGVVWSQNGIYTCIDAQGRRLTSDRPIVECLDREQRQLNPSGTVKRIIPPSMTAEERAREEARRRAEAEAQAQKAEERRRNQVMLMRFPNLDSHQRARAEALQQVQAQTALVHERQKELDKQKAAIDAEFEFYQRDPSKAPEWLKRRRADNTSEREAQVQRLAEQEREAARVNQRFDDELPVLRKLWGDNGAP
jgi:hypothetical protein